MSLVSTPAILLRSHPYSESSQILRFFTRDRGLVSVMARGVRRQRSGKSSSLETFSRGQLIIQHRQGRDLQSFREFAVTDDHRGLAGDIQRFAGASVLADLVLHHAGEEPNEALFDGIDEAYGRLTEAPATDITALILSTAWVMVALLGYAPELSACVHCGQKLRAEEMGRFDFSAGGVRCERCAAAVPDAPRVGPRSRDQLKALLRGELVDGLDRPSAHIGVLRDFVTYHISGSRPLPSFGFLQDIVVE